MLFFVDALVPDDWVLNDDDECPNDSDKEVPGVCGCGISDVDTDSDGTEDCIDLCDRRS